MGAAAEAVIMVIALLDDERGSLFLMERAKRLIRCAGALEFDMGAERLDEIDARTEELQAIF
jgi:hypothetical protein